MTEERRKLILDQNRETERHNQTVERKLDVVIERLDRLEEHRHTHQRRLDSLEDNDKKISDVLGQIKEQLAANQSEREMSKINVERFWKHDWPAMVNSIARVERNRHSEDW